MLNAYRANGSRLPGVVIGGIGKRPLASMRLEIVTTVPDNFQVPINKPFLRSEGFKVWMSCAGEVSSLASNERTFPSGKKRR